MLVREHTVETAISLGNLKDQIAVLLYAMGYAHDNEDISRIELGEIDWNSGLKASIPIKFTTTKQEEIQ